MIPSAFFLIGFFLARDVTASPIHEEVQCDRYLWTVSGDHYSPEPACKEKPQWAQTEEMKSLADRYSTDIRRLYKRQAEDDSVDVADALADIMGVVNSNLNLNIRPKGANGCKACHSVVAGVRDMLKDGISVHILLEIVIGLCIDLKIMTKEVCRGIIHTNGPILLHTVQKSTKTPEQVCAILMRFSCYDYDLEDHWEIDFQDQPARATPRGQVEELPASQAEAPKLKVVHISDTHFDPEYKVNVSDSCKLPLCCRNNEMAMDDSLSGNWGGWKCDMPEKTLNNFLQHIAEVHKDADYIIWTGDLPPHDSWNMNQKAAIRVAQKTISKVTAAFPNIPVYPAIGNHESIPMNQYPTTNESAQWPVDVLYESFAKQWDRWLPKNALETVQLGAFYSTLIKPGFRIISLNTNYCYYNNWWLLVNSMDPQEELKWFADVLAAAEANNEKVHVIGHVPPGGGECLPEWQRNYDRIIERFQNTIAGQFFGHTHSDEFGLVFNNDSKPINVAYMGPSATTYTYMNPGYKVYLIDGDHENTTRTVIDHETWYMDLESANKNNNPVWSKLYSAREAYNLTSLSPENLLELYNRIASDNSTLQLYHKYYWKNSPKRPEICDESCRERYLCFIKSCEQFGSS